MAQSVFDKLGGFSAVSKVVMDFYDEVLDSDIVGDFFEDIDMSKMIDHQTKFVSSILGGPASYSDEQLRKTHVHLHITAVQFQEITSLLDGALAKHGVGAEDRAHVAKEFEARRMFIVTE